MAHIRPKQATGFRAAAMVFVAVHMLAAQTLPSNPSTVDTNGAAKLIAFTGQISVLHLHSDYAWVLNVGSTVERQETVVTGPDGWGLFQVADGSKFEVFPNGRYVFRSNQGDWRDLLEVWLGKVRVQIEHFGGLPNNNKVRTPTAVISVRGTIFTVDVIDQGNATTVTDEEGSVSVAHALTPGSERYLNQGESITVYKNQPIGKALIDKSGVLQRLVHAASDAFYQAALNARNGSIAAGHAGTATSSSTAADQNNGTTTKNGSNSPTAPPPPAPPPPPPH